MGRSSFVFGLGFIHWLILFVHCFPNQSREVFRELQDRPTMHEYVAFKLFVLVVSIQRTSSLTYDRDL